MRILLISAACLTALAVTASAQTAPQRPADAPPAASAPFEQRGDWCMRYVAWFDHRAPVRGPLPSDVRPTQRYEDELAYCKLDPEQYERDTREELPPQPPGAS